MTTPTHYATIQIDTGTVYGIGETPEAALADARRWIDEGETTDDLTTVPCTAAAHAWIKKYGGQSDARLTVSRTGVCLRSEEK